MPLLCDECPSLSYNHTDTDRYQLNITDFPRMCVYVVCHRLLLETNFRLVTWGGALKKSIFGSVVKVRVSLKEMNISLCNVPNSDHGLIYMCVCVCLWEYLQAKR